MDILKLQWIECVQCLIFCLNQYFCLIFDFSFSSFFFVSIKFFDFFLFRWFVFQIKNRTIKNKKKKNFLLRKEKNEKEKLKFFFLFEKKEEKRKTKKKILNPITVMVSKASSTLLTCFKIITWYHQHPFCIKNNTQVCISYSLFILNQIDLQITLFISHYGFCVCVCLCIAHICKINGHCVMNEWLNDETKRNETKQTDKQKIWKEIHRHHPSYINYYSFRLDNT